MTRSFGAVLPSRVMHVKALFVVWIPLAGGEAPEERDGTSIVCPSGLTPGGGSGGWAPVSPALPLAFAERAAVELERRLDRRRLGGLSSGVAAGRQATLPWQAIPMMFPVGGRIRRIRRFVRRIVAGFPELEGATLPPVRSVSAFPDHAQPDAGRQRAGAAGEEALVLATLEGRSLLSFEVNQALLEQGYATPGPIDAFLHRWVESGAVERVAAVGWDESTGTSGDWRCRRCGSDEVALVPCLVCGSERCPQCSDCNSLGRSSACVALYHRPSGDSGGGCGSAGTSGIPAFQDQALLTQVHREGGNNDVSVRLPFSLSTQQSAVSRAVRESRGDALIWAACGAGKTEVTYGAMEDVIRGGGRALFCIPRRDVVQQLGERLQSAFEGVDVVALHGGTPLKYARSPLTVATAHQAVRFRECFDLIVIDEVDAFPLSREAWLRQALERTLKPGGRRIFMSATPPEHLQWLAREGAIATYILPARPHGRPLPVPKVALWGKGRGERLAAVRPAAQSSVAQGRRIILFVPTVRQGYDLLAALGDCGLGRIDYVHGGDRRRAAKLKEAEAGEIDVLISTTVLERGVTIPKVDVAVIDADSERVFDAAALIQMAGRSGRKPDAPEGRVTFFAERMTPAIRIAVHTVQELNRLAGL